MTNRMDADFAGFEEAVSAERIRIAATRLTVHAPWVLYSFLREVAAKMPAALMMAEQHTKDTPDPTGGLLANLPPTIDGRLRRTAVLLQGVPLYAYISTLAERVPSVLLCAERWARTPSDAPKPDDIGELIPRRKLTRAERLERAKDEGNPFV